MAVRGIRDDALLVRHTATGGTLKAGALAGIIGGLLLAAFAMMMAVSNGEDILSPVRMIGATFIGPDALDGGAGIVMYGLILHVVTSIVWGVLFAAILPRTASVGFALVAGLIYGLVVMVVMLFLVMPIVNPTMRDAVSPMMTPFAIEHLLFGAALALVPIFRRRYEMHVEEYKRSP
ncbi:MAG: hypothetical protein ACT4R6_14555 [Gemmatimonadaceae bacterium]